VRPWIKGREALEATRTLQIWETLKLFFSSIDGLRRRISLGQGDQKIGKIFTQILEKVAKTVAQSPKHLHKATFET